MKLEHDSCRFREQRERNKSTEGILPLETHLSHPDGNSSTTCVLQVHTNLARHRFTRVAFWRMHSSAARDLARFAYSRFVPRSINASKIKSPSLVNPANFSPKRRNIWSRRRGEIGGERHFLAYWILEKAASVPRDLFSNFPWILFHQGASPSEMPIEFSPPRFSNCRREQNRWEF